LRVLDEIEWSVPPLDAPQLDASEPPDAARALQEYSALRLFSERVRAVKPDFELDDHSATQVAHICAQLDGLPLAIELAAARLRGMTVSELAARLTDRFQLLSGGARSAPTRHQTLRAAIDWSYNLLSAPERALLRRFAVFSGGWTLEAAEAIADTEADALANPVDLLLQLVNKSLVVAETRGSTTRYRLLETIRQYASEKLHEAGGSEEIQNRHFDHFLQMAEQWHDVTMVGRHYMLWLDRLEAEMDNLRAAYAWSRRLQDADARALRLAGALWPFWFNRGRLAEGLRWLEEALTHAPNAPAQVRATALVGISTLNWYVLEPMQVVVLAEEAVRLCRQAGDRMGMAHAYFILAESTNCLSDFDLAEEYYTQATELFREVKWLPGVGRCLAFWITARVQSGGVAQAISIYEECLAIGQQVDDHSVSACALEGLLSVDRQRGKDLYRQELARRRAKMAAAPSDSRYEAESLAGLLQSYGRQVHFSGEPEDVVESIAALEECLSLWKGLGIQWSIIGGTARAHFDLGIPLLLMNKYAESIATEEEAIRLYTEVGDWQGVVWAQTKIGWSALGLRDFTLAQNSFCASLRYAPDGSIGYAPLALAGMAELARLQGDITRAGRLYSAAMHFEIQEEPLGTLPAIKAIPTYLDDLHFAAAWAEGTAMTLPQAITYALS
jgi:predicted ATPase